MINRLHLEMIRLYAGDPKRIQHFCKVHSYSKLIAAMENVDEKTSFILEAASLTHDICIHFCEEKYGNCNGKLQEKEGPDIAGVFSYCTGETKDPLLSRRRSVQRFLNTRFLHPLKIVCH